MHHSQLPIEFQKALLSTDMKILRAISFFAAFASKSDVSSVFLLAWLTFLQ